MRKRSLVVGGVCALILLGFVLDRFLHRRRQIRRMCPPICSMPDANASAERRALPEPLSMNALSPRLSSAHDTDAKVQPYTQIEDDRDALAALPPAYSTSKAV